MSFLLDTNVLSEWVKPEPNAGVVAWLSLADEDRIFISVVTIAELRHGVERLPPSGRRDRLDVWLTEQLPARFEGRILQIDVDTATAWGRVMARGQAAGRPMSTMDAFIAATAESRSLTIVTRNVRDFEVTDLPVIDPWKT